MIDYEKVSMLENKYETFFERLMQDKKEIVLCGGGAGCDWSVRFLNTRNITPQFIIDNNAKLKERQGIEIIGMEEAMKKYKDASFYILITTPKYEEELTNELQKYVSRADIVCFESELYYSYIHNLDEYRRYLKEHSNEFKQFSEILEDEKSRKTLLNVLAGRITADFSYFKEVYEPRQYFAEGIICLADGDIFVDVGACDGDTLNIIEDLMSGKEKKVYCLEPDEKCFQQLQVNAQKMDFNIELIKKGAWDRQQVLSFEEDASHGASKIVLDKKTEITINLDKIDHLINENDMITHMKMDIEGAEYRALVGAENMIKRCKPQLAICVYHKNEDILEISNLLRQMVPDYKFYLRHHNISGTETVLYAVI